MTKSGTDTERATAALADLNDRANLSDAQVKQMDAAQAALDGGDNARAAKLAVALDQQVRGARQAYTVRSGDNLQQIAAKPEIYGNGYLWPLIWKANRRRLPDPSALPANLKLIIEPYPTLEQTADALDYSHNHSLQNAKP